MQMSLVNLVCHFNGHRWIPLIYEIEFSCLPATHHAVLSSYKGMLRFSSDFYNFCAIYVFHLNDSMYCATRGDLPNSHFLTFLSWGLDSAFSHVINI